MTPCTSAQQLSAESVARRAERVYLPSPPPLSKRREIKHSSCCQRTLQATAEGPLSALEYAQVCCEFVLRKDKEGQIKTMSSSEPIFASYF